MSALGERLAKVRNELGHTSARQFFKFLEDHGNLGFNYSYYVRIEKGEQRPSHAVVSRIGQILGENHYRLLVLSYCSDLFPNMTHLFAGTENQISLPAVKGKSTNTDTGKVLTLRQISALSKTQVHYFVFLLLHQSRRPILLQELKELLPARELAAAIDDLKDAKILKVEGQKIFGTSPEVRMPRAETESLSKTYQRLDTWDRELDQYFKFEEIQNKMVLRRISPRFLGLIQNGILTVLEMVRAAEETQPDHNTEVVTLNLRLSRGRLPG